MTQESLLVILGTAVMTALVSATVFLFQRFENSKQQLILTFEGQLILVNKRLEDCETDRNALRQQIVAIHIEMAELKKRLP